jgi:kinesin family protein 18/19
MDMIVKGNEYRTMSPTEANATSSRSHAVLQINVTQRDRNADVNEPHTMATLSIIDLAGSERASATKNRGERLLEGANINKSLLALGSCINALCDPRKKNHVPYRNSKLTRLLKFSLGGNCKTVMIVCVSPSSAHFDETQNTLRYANRAKNIQTKVTRNVYNVNRHVKDFLKKIDEQLAMINELKQQQRESETAAFAKFRRQSEKKDAVAREGIGRIRAAYEHSLPERKEKISYMRKQRYTERRIAMINSWIAAFEATCEAHDDDDGALLSCQAVRKTAQGILLELEGSRQHYHQRLAKLNWERTLDSALQTGLRQLADTEGATDNTHTANLTRETELLKCRGEQEALAAVLEHERGADAVMVQMLLQAHFETIALVNRLLTLDEASAVDEARAILTKILITCTDTTTCVVQPDSRLIGDEAHMPPGSTGTPKRRRPSTLSGPSPLARRLSGAAAFAAAPRRSSVSPVKGSPAKNSPRKRKVPITKKTVVFTPKKRTPTKRSVRWRDDVENGQLTEFARTPQHFDSTPEMTPSAKAYGGSRGSGGARASNSIVAAAAAAATATLADDSSSSSPLSAMQAPPSMSLHVKNKRFRSGFLAKRSDGSPNAPLPGSDSENSPLRDLEPGRASNRSALHVVHTSLAAAVPQPTDSPSDAAAAATGSADNGAVDAGSNGWSGSADPAARRTGASATELGAVAETADGAAITGGPLPPPPPRMLKSAMKRTSSMGSGAAGAGVVIVGGGGGGGGGGGALRVHRRRSPSAMMGGGGASRASSVSPPADGGLAYFTAGHARRMVRGGEKENVMQGSSVLSPRTAPIIKTSSARRSTLSSGSDGIGSSGSGSGGRHSSAGTTVVASLSSRDAIRLSMLAAAGAGSVGGSGSRSSSRESVVGSVAVGVGGGRGSWR